MTSTTASESFTYEEKIESTDQKEVISEVSSEVEEKPLIIENYIKIEDITTNNSELKTFGDLNVDVSKIQSILNNYNKNISILTYSLDGKKAIAYNTEKTYFSACTIKAGYVLSCCSQIEEKMANKDTLLTYQSKHYHDGSGKIKNQPYGTQYTIEKLIHECLSISDNVAYEMLYDYFGIDHYNRMINDLGCDGLSLNGMWAYKVKVNDLAALWLAINKYFESGSEMSNILKNACTNTPFNYGSRFLTNVNYSHKSGDNFGQFAAYNDAGIVWSENPYVYVVLTNSEGDSIDKNTVDNAMSQIFEIMQS